MEYLIKRGADAKAVDSTGQNALHYFQRWDLIGRDANAEITNKIVAFVDQLIQHGVDVNSQDKSGITPLMSAAKSCSPAAIKLLLSYGANPALSNKLGQSALDIAIDRATRSGQGDGCNAVVKVLANPQQVSRTSASLTDSLQQNSSPEKDISQTQGVPAQNAANFAGTYSGTYIGSDSGSFQVSILQDGTAKLDGRSSQVGTTFTGKGKISPDGHVAVGSASTGSTFTGSIGPSGVLSGTWKNTAHNQAGSFQGSKDVTTATNPLQVINGGLQLLNSILKPR